MNYVAGQSRLGQYRFRTGDQALVRQINLAVIMYHLRENAPISSMNHPAVVAEPVAWRCC